MKDYNYDKDHDIEKFFDLNPEELSIQHSIEKTLDSLLFEQSYKNVDKLKKLHNINSRQISYIEDQLQKCIENLKR